MSGNGRSDEVLVVALASGQSHEEAAAAAGLSSRTLRRRLEDLEFRSRVAEERERYLEAARGQLASGAGRAAAVLLAIAEDPEAPAQARVSACREVLGSTLRRRDAEVMREMSAPEQRALEYTVNLAFRHLDRDGQRAFLAEWKTQYLALRF